MAEPQADKKTATEAGTTTAETAAPEVTPEAVAAAAAAAAAPGLDLEVKHPLHSRWALWFDSPAKKPGATRQEEWTMNLKHLIEFDTVEDFWSVWNVLIVPSKLAIGSNYHLFRSGIEPKWEDPTNTRGGKWVATTSKRPAVNVHSLDDLWLFACLSCIGEQYEDNNDAICGVVVSPRSKQDRVSLWTRDRTNPDTIRAIGRCFKLALELPEALKISYQFHEDSVKHGSSWNAAHFEL